MKFLFKYRFSSCLTLLWYNPTRCLTSLLCSGSPACVFLTGAGWSQTPLCKQHRYLMDTRDTAIRGRQESLIKENEVGFLIHSHFHLIRSGLWLVLAESLCTLQNEARMLRRGERLLNSVHGLKILTTKTHYFTHFCYFELCIICIYYAHTVDATQSCSILLVFKNRFYIFMRLNTPEVVILNSMQCTDSLVNA